MQIKPVNRGHEVESILVLGLIPGTNIAISFQVWIALIVLLIIARPVHNLYIQYELFMLERVKRQPLHASQLHRRLHLTAR